MDISVIKLIKKGYLRAEGKDKLKELYRKANEKRQKEEAEKNSTGTMEKES